ncbi:hypothetical protein CERSUDRAFT_50942, partial [Gelatoporia subvermispora B]
DFVPKLTDHLISRLRGIPYDGDKEVYSNEDRLKIRFKKNRLYQHKKMRVNYTTYDMRRAQDSINPRTHGDVMLLSCEDQEEVSDPHPYWYARVVGIYHVDVCEEVAPRQWSDSQQMDFVLVRWFGRDLKRAGGFSARRLPRVGFMHGDDPGAFGFLDPKLIIRNAHIILGFAGRRTDELMGPSIARQSIENDEDWDYYCVNM